MFFVRSTQPVCREPSEARVSSAFDLLSLFLLQDEAVEPYLRHPYTFEVQERVMPGQAQVARRHGQGLLNHNSKILRAFYVSRGLLPQNSNLTLGAFAPQFWGVLFLHHPFLNFGPGGNALKSAQVGHLLLSWYGRAASGLPVIGMTSLKKLQLWSILQWHNLNSSVKINQSVQKLKFEDTQINKRAKWSRGHTISLSFKNSVPSAENTFHPLT